MGSSISGDRGPVAGRTGIYAALKRELAARFGADRSGYTNAKSDHFWVVIRRVDQWAKDTGWEPGASDG